jgi:hypothetical protein
MNGLIHKEKAGWVRDAQDLFSPDFSHERIKT